MLVRMYLLALLATCSGAALSQQKANPALPCFHALSGDPRFASIREKVALGGTWDEMHRMTKSAERASREEAAVLETWRKAREDCHQQELPYFATRANELAAVAMEHFSAVQSLITRLKAGALTYGDFGKRRIELYEQTMRRTEEVRKSIVPAKPRPHTPGQ